jgi:hypothetical protein
MADDPTYAFPCYLERLDGRGGYEDTIVLLRPAEIALLRADAQYGAQSGELRMLGTMYFRGGARFETAATDEAWSKLRRAMLATGGVLQVRV